MIEYALSKCREQPYERGKFRHYALVLDRKNRIISESANSYSRTHTVMYKASRKLGLVKDFLHSEVAALIRDRERKGAKLVVVRVLADGSAANSEPCQVCRLLIEKEFTNIKSIEFSV